MASAPVRQRTGGVPAASRPQQPVRTPSQQFVKPQWDWRHEEGSSILLVYLPSFTKDQLKVTYEEPTRSIRVRGDRRLPNNRWVRLNESFSVPEYGDGSKMETQFGRGILMITVPRTVAAQQVVTPIEQPKGTKIEVPKPGDDKVVEQKAPKGKGNVSPLPKKTPSHDEIGSLEKATGDPKSQKGVEVPKPENVDTVAEQKAPKGKENVSPLPKKTPSDDEIVEAGSGSPKKATGELKSQKGVEEVPTTTTTSSIVAETAEQKDERKAKALSIHQSTGVEPKPQSAESEKPEQNAVVEKAEDKEKESKEYSATVVPKSKQKGKEKSEKSADDSADARLKGMENVPEGSAKNGPAIAMELIENGKLLFNMGVAALVIVGLGTFLFRS